MNDLNTSSPGVQDVGIVTYISEAHYRFLTKEARKRGLNLSDIIRRIVENAIRDAKESD